VLVNDGTRLSWESAGVWWRPLAYTRPGCQASLIKLFFQKGKSRQSSDIAGRVSPCPKWDQRKRKEEEEKWYSVIDTANLLCDASQETPNPHPGLSHRRATECPLIRDWSVLERGTNQWLNPNGPGINGFRKSSAVITGPLSGS